MISSPVQCVAPGWTACRTRCPIRRPELGFSIIHGAADDKLETSLGKLLFLGFHRGIEPFDGKCRVLLDWLATMLAHRRDHTDAHRFADFFLSLVGSLLSLTDHAGTSEVGAVIALRRDTIHDFVRRGTYDIYAPWSGNPPRVAKGRPLIDPRLYREGGFRLPWHYDLHLFGAMAERERNADLEIAAIVDYVLAPEFESLLPEYGMVEVAPRRYMVCGWKPRLPRPTDEGSEGLLAALLMMAPFSAARQSQWFKAGLDYLDRFRNGETYDLPKALIRERSPGYWPWNRMRLEQRRGRSSHTLESTFWVLKIRKLAGLL